MTTRVMVTGFVSLELKGDYLRINLSGGTELVFRRPEGTMTDQEWDAQMLMLYDQFRQLHDAQTELNEVRKMVRGPLDERKAELRMQAFKLLLPIITMHSKDANQHEHVARSAIVYADTMFEFEQMKDGK